MWSDTKAHDSDFFGACIIFTSTKSICRHLGLWQPSKDGAKSQTHPLSTCPTPLQAPTPSFIPWWSWRKESMWWRCWCRTLAAQFWGFSLRSTSPCASATPSEIVNLRPAQSWAPVWGSASSRSSSSSPVWCCYCVSPNMRGVQIVWNGLPVSKIFFK